MPSDPPPHEVTGPFGKSRAMRRKPQPMRMRWWCWLVLFSFNLACAKDFTPATAMRLWPGTTESTESASPRGNGILQHINVPTLTAFLPQTNHTGMAVIICPGGGYTVSDYERHGVRLAERLNQAGIAVFVLKYRLAPPSTNVVAEALADGLRAVRMVRSRAVEYGVDPDRIGMIGFSAGANLTLHVASEFDLGDAHSSDPINQASSRPDFIGLLCLWAGPGKTNCPYPLRPHSPPAFICHALDDKVAPVSVSTDTAARLKDLQIPVELHLFEKGGHGAFTPGNTHASSHWPDLFVAWLKTAYPSSESAANASPAAAQD